MALTGKHRGIVRNNVDPSGIARLQVEVPSVSGDAVWAMPCVPFVAGLKLPPIGTNVWVEYEAGDAARPIWVGFFFESSDDLPKSFRP